MLRNVCAAHQRLFRSVRLSFSTEQSSNVNVDRKHKLNRLKYQAKQRGMKETCILIGGFAEDNLHKMSDSQLEQFDKILQEIDPALNEWICGTKPFPEDLEGDVAQQMMEYAKSNPLKYKFTDNIPQYKE